MKNLKKLFESFTSEGTIHLNSHMEVCFEIDYKERVFDFSKITYDDSLQYNLPEEAPKKYTKFEKVTHRTWFRHDDENMACKVLEWLSRPALKEGNETVRRWYLIGINKYLGTKFSHEDIEEIYCKLGNEVNRPLTLKFIESGYDMEVLK